MRRTDDFEVGDLVQHHIHPDVIGVVVERDDVLGQARIRGDHRWWNSHNLYRVEEDS